MDLEKIAPILEQIIKDAIAEKVYPFGFGKYKGTSNKIASKKLYDSIKVNAVKKSGMFVLQVIMIEYGQYVQAGRKPGNGYVPIKSLLEWIKDRKLKGRNKQGQYISNESFAFAIRSNIRKFGVKPAPFIDISMEKILEDPRIIEIIGNEAYDDLINAIEGI